MYITRRESASTSWRVPVFHISRISRIPLREMHWGSGCALAASEPCPNDSDTRTKARLELSPERGRAWTVVEPETDQVGQLRRIEQHLGGQLVDAGVAQVEIPQRAQLRSRQQFRQRGVRNRVIGKVEPTQPT